MNTLRTLVCALVVLAITLGGRLVARTDELPQDARSVFEEYQRAAGAIQEKAENEIRPIREKTIQHLQVLQDQYCRAAKLDEAVAIRDLIRDLKGVRSDPGTLHVRPEDMGRAFLYEVTGSAEGAIWGTEVYTNDSHLGTAAVHMGLLRPGQKGVVKVRILPGQKTYSGSTRNGITSQSYGPWNISFTIETYK